MAQELGATIRAIAIVVRIVKVRPVVMAAIFANSVLAVSLLVVISSPQLSDIFFGQCFLRFASYLLLRSATFPFAKTRREGARSHAGGVERPRGLYRREGYSA